MIKSITSILFLSSILLLVGCNNSKEGNIPVNDDNIPSSEGNIPVSEANTPVNNDTEQKIIQLNDTMIISENDTNILNKHFICNGTHFEAIEIQADNILIQNSLFENCDTAINIQQANNVTIKGNRFENIGAGVILNGKANNVSVIYNEFRKIGERDCTRATGGGNCNVIAARQLSSNANFSYNLIDNHNSNSFFMEDYISVYTGKSNISSNVEINNNLIIGSSVKNASSYSGGCIILDGRTKNNLIQNNQCYNVSGYGIAAASSSYSSIIKNRIYITKKHHDSIKRDQKGVSHVYGFGATKFHKVCASHIIFTKNDGYVYHEAYPNNVKVAWMPCLEAGDKNSYPDGTYANNITLEGNNFRTDDPHWEIPQNIFSNLGKNYYSGNH